MLSEEEKKEITEELKHYPDARAVCVEALKIVQRCRGWVTDEGVRDIAAFLDMTAEELEGVATFYNLIFRRPVGRHVIFLCDSISCWVMGYERLRERLCAHLGIQMGETARDGRFTLLPIPCLGTCDHAPALMIDNDLHRDVAPEKIEAILEAYK
ncbi:MAG TPA: NADH-quinone oxidoreductase subunit NuoE [Terriglobales bacterium]|jgi:NADH-quinone oxidoreductase subunit E|nr:NADH-quinone oxidoreductase subunit NuoE [Terriglobales bacterium]